MGSWIEYWIEREKQLKALEERNKFKNEAKMEVIK